MTLDNRSLDRGLAVIAALARGGAMSLADLHQETGLAKSTLRRLLATLIRRRFALRSLADGRYRAAITLPDFATEPVPRGMALVADASLPHALDLTRSIGWPSDIHVRDGSAMRIVESTRPASPFLLHRGEVNRRVNHFASAAGMACLAELPESEVSELDRRTRGDPLLGLARFGLDLAGYMKLLEAARARGCAARLAAYAGETVPDDSLSAIAVPLRLDGRPVGGLTLLWPRTLKSVEEFASEHVEALRRAGFRIEEDLAHLAVG